MTLTCSYCFGCTPAHWIWKETMTLTVLSFSFGDVWGHHIRPYCSHPDVWTHCCLESLMHTLEVCSCCSPVLPSSPPSLFPLFSVIYLLFIFSASPLSLSFPPSLITLMRFYLWDWRHYLLSQSLYPLVFIYHTAISTPVPLTPTVCISFTLSLIHHFPSFPLLLTSSILFLLPLKSKHFTLNSPLSSLK